MRGASGTGGAEIRSAEEVIGAVMDGLLRRGMDRCPSRAATLNAAPR
jgi:hypothetical protein